jgi:hypothetical protein
LSFVEPEIRTSLFDCLFAHQIGGGKPGGPGQWCLENGNPASRVYITASLRTTRRISLGLTFILQLTKMAKERTVIAFDLYGTLLSTESIAQELGVLYGDDRAKVVAAQWRRYQLEYTWRINSMGK